MSSKGPIIIVDDDEDDQYIYGEICKKLQVINDVKFFPTAASVLAYLRTTPEKPSIIFCDINLPEMDGLQLRRHICNEEHLRQKSIPFVFFSTAATVEQVKLAFQLTVQGFFIKDNNFAAAESTVRTILEYWAKCRHPNA